MEQTHSTVQHLDESHFICSHLRILPLHPDESMSKCPNADERGSNARSGEIATCVKFERFIADTAYVRESESSSSVAHRSGKNAAPPSRDEAMLRSSDGCANRASAHGTARPVAVSSASLMDLTLYHAPSDEVNNFLEIEAMRNVCEKIGVQEDSLGLRHFAVHQALCESSMNTCMWATLRQSKAKISTNVSSRTLT